MTTWMLTGGAGYIGSHVLRALLEVGHDVVVLDDLSTGVAARVPPGVPLVVASVLDRPALEDTLARHGVEGVIHLAGKKAVEESLRFPLRYYRENVDGVLAVLESVRAVGVPRLAFSSSAAVYGASRGGRVDETSPTAPETPYGHSKLASEWAVEDVTRLTGIGAISLRYFNVVGCADPLLADVGGTNLFPRLLDALATGSRPVVFGSDYPTPDGTCVRDYLHVADLARAHVAALAVTEVPGHQVVNIGRGEGYSVLEVVDAFARVTGRDLDPVLGPRRIGDPATMVADATKARTVLGWTAREGLDAMVASACGAGSPRVAGRFAGSPG